MGVKWKDVAHLTRPALMFLFGLGLFLLLRSYLVPPTFGQLGHFRAGVLQEVRRTPVRFAGQAACAACHVDQKELLGKGRHAGVSCEACHGPAAAHASDPTSGKPAIAEATPLCGRCHEKDAAKPGWFKQVATAEHSGGAPCLACHKAHQPHL